MNRPWRIVLILASLVLFVLAVGRIGVGNVIGQLAAIGYGVVVIVCLSWIRTFLQTRAWSMALQQDGIHAPNTELFFLRLAAQGIGYLTVLGPAASEPMKIKLLQSRGGSATAATLVDTGVYWLSAGLVLILGCLSMAFVFVRTTSNAAVPILCAVAIAAVYAAIRSKPVLHPLVGRVGNKCPVWLAKSLQVEVRMREFAHSHPDALRHMFLLGLACQALLLVEIAVALSSLHLPAGPGSVLAIEAAGRAARILGGWMPARLGADESSAAGAFAALGLPVASGVALALARRARDLLNSFAGLLWLAWRARPNEYPRHAQLNAYEI